MITETNIIESTDYKYRLVFPDGKIWDRTLPFKPEAGDILVLDKPYKVNYVYYMAVYSDISLFLGREA